MEALEWGCFDAAILLSHKVGIAVSAEQRGGMAATICPTPLCFALIIVPGIIVIASALPLVLFTSSDLKRCFLTLHVLLFL